MEIKQICKKDLKKADYLQQSILNPENKKRYRSFLYVYKNYLKVPSLFISAYSKNKIIGIIFGYVKKNKILLGEMAIRDKYRGKGIGRKLLKKFEENSRKLNKDYIELGARSSAERFYLNNNYKPVLFVQIYYNKVPKNYKKLNYKIINETNYKDAKRLFIKVNNCSKKIKRKAEKDFKAYNVIYLFRKKL